MYRTGCINNVTFVNVTGEAIAITKKNRKSEEIIERIIPTAGILERFESRGGDFAQAENQVYLILASDVEAIANKLGLEADGNKIQGRPDIRVIKSHDDDQFMTISWTAFKKEFMV